MRVRAHAALLLCALLACSALGQHPAAIKSGDSESTWITEAVGPQRFVGVHGRKAVVMGYAATGLEVWAYPLQLISNYHVGFLLAGQTQAIPGPSLLRRIEYHPEDVERVYVGDDFIVRERIFVPLDEPGAIFSYEMEGRRDVTVQVQFDPSLNLMWPGALGGQSIHWSNELPGYVLMEPLYGFSAKISSPDAIAHDTIVNRTIQPSEEQNHQTLVLQPKTQASGPKLATLFVGYDGPSTAANAGIIATLQQHQAELRDEVTRHDEDLLAHALRIETPDAELNRALQWSILALDQAWVCNATLGCGEVAGYGPSRPGRRPQYDWFFAGDGLVAVNALLDAGEYDRAREELAFITKYQDKKNGMIWHELSQSASFVDWEAKYPYMYVHVDTTFQYLTTLAHYVQVSGDEGFLKVHWSDVQKAYRYAESLIDSTTKLPVIPLGKEGGNEQDRMHDDLGLSSAWIDAASGFVQMARVMESPEAAQAEREMEAARSALARNSWDPVHRFWIAGHTLGGEAIYDQRPHPSGVLDQHIFSATQTEQIVDQIAAPDFQTDWGTRSMSASSAQFNPDSYAAGSVSALGSSVLATTFWQQHRSLTGWQIWHDLLPWNTLDAEGHLHEVLAGDFYHPQVESVPEQTWSSAGYLSAAVSGLLGLQVRSRQRQVTFAPHLPAQWNEITIRNVRVEASLLALHLSRDNHGITLEMVNTGDPVSFTFTPEIPLGATLGRAMRVGANSMKIEVPPSIELHAQDEHATATFKAPKGMSRCRIAFEGGVLLAPIAPSPLIGEPSRNLHLSSISLAGRTLTIKAFVNSQGSSTLKLYTSWKPARATGGTATPEAPAIYLLRFNPPEDQAVEGKATYMQRSMVIQF